MEQILANNFTLVEAAKRLKISYRQARRILKNIAKPTIWAWCMNAAVSDLYPLHLKMRSFKFQLASSSPMTFRKSETIVGLFRAFAIEDAG